MTELQHLSYSSISTYLTCARSWAFRYRESVPIATAPALAFGSAFHGAVEDLIRRQCKGDIQTAPMEVWREQWAKASQQQIAWGPNETPEQYSNDGLRMLLADDTLRAIRSLRPLMEEGKPVIEKRIELRVPGVPIPVIGFIDMVGEDGTIVDFKTSGRVWTQEKADTEQQPAYYLAALNQLGEKPTGFRYVVWVKGKNPQVQVLNTQRKSADLFQLLHLIQEVWEAIRAGVFIPRTDTWKHSPTYCEYWVHCPYGGK